MLLLASASPARRRLLDQAGIACRVRVSGLEEERFRDPDPERLVLTLAEAKALAVAEQAGRELLAADGSRCAALLACDSLLCIGTEVFGKPRDAAEAIERWRRMAGRWGALHTGHCLLQPGRDGGPEPWRSSLQTVTTRLRFAPLDERQIERYVASGEPLACAGGFALEGRGGLVVERLEGCWSNVIGLSLPLLRQWLPALCLGP